jgi:Family of unknown function (DUF5993)
MGPAMDTLSLLLILATALLAYRGMSRRWVIVLWSISLIAMLCLFKYHVTSKLHLHF